MIEMTEIRQLSDSDLQERIEVEREALAKLRFNHTVAGLESTPVAIGVHTCCTCARSRCAGTSRGCSYNPLVPTSNNLATRLPAMQAPLAARHPGRLRHCEPAPARFQAEQRARPSVKGSRCSCRYRAQAVGTPPNARPQGEPGAPALGAARLHDHGRDRDPLPDGARRARGSLSRLW